MGTLRLLAGKHLRNMLLLLLTAYASVACCPIANICIYSKQEEREQNGNGKA